MPRPTLATMLALLLGGASLQAAGQASAPAPRSAAQSPPNAEMARLLSAAHMWNDKDRADLARGVLEKVLLIDPVQPDALLLLGLIEIRSNQPAEAAKLLQRLQRAHPGHPATRELGDALRIATRDKRELAITRRLAQNSEYEEANAHLRALFPDGAPSGELAMDYYRIAAGLPGGRARAIAELRRRTRERPDDPYLQLTLASLLTDRSAQREEGLGMLYDIAPRAVGQRRKTALEIWRRTLYGVEDDIAYYRWYERYLNEVPDDAAAREAFVALGRKVEAQRRLEADPAYQAQKRGLVQLERGDLAEAETALEYAYQKRPDDAEAVGGLGMVRLRQGRHDEARELFARALRLDQEKYRDKWRSLVETAGFWGTIAAAREANARGLPGEAETLARRALAKDRTNASAQAVLADAWVAQGKTKDAEALLRRMLARPEPDIDALRRLVRLLQAQGRDAETGPLIAATAKRLSGQPDGVRELRAELLSVQADQLLAQQLRSPAIARLEAALRLQPDAPWTRYTLARLYRDLGMPALGRTVMEDGLAASGASEMRHAAALYLSAVDDIDAASATLAAVPEAERSDGIRRLAAGLSARHDLVEAQRRIARGDEAGARALLERAAGGASEEPQLLASIGREWIGLGEADKGLALVGNWLDAHPAEPSPDVRLRYGELLAAAERDEALRAWIDASRAMPGLDADQRAALDDQSLRLALRRANRQIADDDFDGARATLDGIPAAQQEDRRWLLTLADLRDAQGDYAGAANAARRVLATLPDDPGARLALASALQREGRDAQALALTRTVLAEAPEADIDTRLGVARRLTSMRREDEAATVVDDLARRYPEHSDITLQQGRTAQSRGDYDVAGARYREARLQEQRESVLLGPDGTPATRALRDLDARRQTQVATAVLQSNKSGDSGVSRLYATEIPLYVRIARGYTGHLFFHADTVLLNAGTLEGSHFRVASHYGKIGALGNAGVGRVDQTDSGVALAAGYEHNGAYSSWRADLGSTPLGFTEETLVGGLRYRADLGPASLNVDVSRRAVTSSLVSYAGARDPVTGETWGGVVRNGFRVHYAHDIGPATVSADLGAGLYTGHNVETNREFTARAAIEIPVFKRPNQQVTSGLTLNYWHYAENQRYYTFGHGGYYSPQRYVSLSLPLDWTGRRGEWSWRLQGSAGWSSTREDAVPYYPTRPDLQQRAGNPFYTGGTGGGFSYTIGGVVEYRLDRQWFIGAGFQIDRSHDYAPNRAMAWLRYLFERQPGPVSFPPDPVRPYSTY